MRTFSLIVPVSIEVLKPMNIHSAVIPETNCTHVVNMLKNNKVVDRLPFIYDGDQVIQYALDLCKRYGKIADTIEITTL